MSSLKDGVGTHKHVVTNVCSPRDMHTILNDRIVANIHGRSAQYSTSIPKGRVLSYSDIPQNCSVGSHKASLVELWIDSIVGKSAETGGETVLTQSFTLNGISQLIEFLASCADGWPKESFIEVADDFIQNESHLVYIMLIGSVIMQSFTLVQLQQFFWQV